MGDWVEWYQIGVIIGTLVAGATLTVRRLFKTSAAPTPAPAPTAPQTPAQASKDDAELTRVIKILSDRIGELAASHESLTAQFQQQGEELKSVKQAQWSLETMTQGQHQRIVALETQLETSKLALEAKSAECLRLRKQLQEERADRKRLEAELTKRTTECEALRAQISALQQQIDALQQARQGLQP